jgi:hypothetical protein
MILVEVKCVGLMRIRLGCERWYGYLFCWARRVRRDGCVVHYHSSLGLIEDLRIVKS